MNKHTEVLQLQELHEVESGLNTRISEVYDYPPAKKIAERLFDLNDELNLLLNKRADAVGLNIKFGAVPVDTSHLNNDDFGAFIRGEINEHREKLS